MDHIFGLSVGGFHHYVVLEMSNTGFIAMKSLKDTHSSQTMTSDHIPQFSFGTSLRLTIVVENKI